MSELLIRSNATDVALLRRVLGPQGLQSGSAPDRLVVDAHVAARQPEVRRLAAQSGTGLLIDPQTHFLQDRQPRADPWAALPYAHTGQMHETDFTPAFVENLVQRCIQTQLELGATEIIAPYVHIGHRREDWRAVQCDLWRTTRRILDESRVTLPIMAVLSLDWKAQVGVFDGTTGAELLRSLHELAPDDIALATSAAIKGRDPEDRIESMLTLVAQLSPVARVFVWQQGLLGEICVAAGAAGYETGIGTREAYDVSGTLAAHRGYGERSGHGARPVYVRPLQRSVPKSTVAALSENPRLWPLVFCHDEQCCEPDGRAMLGDARQHAVMARKRALQELDAIEDPRWRWEYLVTRARQGADLAVRINRIAANDPRVKKVPPNPLIATHAVAERRSAHRVRTTA